MKKTCIITGIALATTGALCIPTKQSKPAPKQARSVTQTTHVTHAQRATDIQTAFKHNRTGKKPIVIMLHADWCGACKHMKPVVQEVLRTFKDVIFLDVNEKYKEAQDELIKKTGLQNVAYPTFIFVDRTGKQEIHVGGLSKNDFAKKVEKHTS